MLNTVLKSVRLKTVNFKSKSTDNELPYRSYYGNDLRINVARFVNDSLYRIMFYEETILNYSIWL